MNYYSVNLTRLGTSGAFLEASVDELRVLLCIIALGERPVSKEMLAEKCKVSPARVSAAIALWTECGVISTDDCELVIDDPWTTGPSTPIITESKSELAESIRDSGIADMIHECTKMMKKAALNTPNIERLTALVTEEGLSPEYVLLLASHLAPKKEGALELTAFRLARQAKKLIRDGITTVEDLVAYIDEKENIQPFEVEICKIVHRENFYISKQEKKYFDCWINQFAFGLDIIAEAFDICNENCHKYIAGYMNTILKSWFEAGCKTLEECQADREKNRELYKKKAETALRTRKKKETEIDTPKYSEFDAEDALMRALARSYGDEE